MEHNNKIYGIDLIRIISCVCVYSMHYLGMELNESQNAMEAFRSSIWVRTVIGITVTEPVLIAFFVMAGFLMTYSPTGSRPREGRDVANKCVHRCLNIVVPTVLVILFTALAAGIMKLLGISDMFSLSELGRDLVKVIIGIPGDKHIHYGYPLWFQHFILLGYIFGYAFLYLFGKNDRARYLAYIAVLIYSLFNSEYIYMVFCGMVAGELCSKGIGDRVRKLFGRDFIYPLAAFLALSLMAALFDSDYDRPVIYGPAAALIAIFMILVYCTCMNNKDRRTADRAASCNHRMRRFIDFLAANTYGCYLVHFFVFCSVMRVVYRLSRSIPLIWTSKWIGCTVMFLVMTFFVWLFGSLLTRFVLNPLKKFYDAVWKRLSFL